MKTHRLIICRVRRHAEQFPAGEAPHGPDIVELGSARHNELQADPDTRTA